MKYDSVIIKIILVIIVDLQDLLQDSISRRTGDTLSAQEPNQQKRCPWTRFSEEELQVIHLFHVKIMLKVE